MLLFLIVKKVSLEYFFPVGNAVSEELSVNCGGVRGPPAHPDRGRGEVVRRGYLRPAARSCKSAAFNHPNPSRTARYLNTVPPDAMRCTDNQQPSPRDNIISSMNGLLIAARMNTGYSQEDEKVFFWHRSSLGTAAISD